MSTAACASRSCCALGRETQALAAGSQGRLGVGPLCLGFRCLACEHCVASVTGMHQAAVRCPGPQISSHRPDLQHSKARAGCWGTGGSGGTARQGDVVKEDLGIRVPEISLWGAWGSSQTQILEQAPCPGQWPGCAAPVMERAVERPWGDLGSHYILPKQPVPAKVLRSPQVPGSPVPPVRRAALLLPGLPP